MSGIIPHMAPKSRVRSGLVAACAFACGTAAALMIPAVAAAAGETSHPEQMRVAAKSDNAGKTAKPTPPPAKKMFGAAKTPAPLASRAIGSYARGCLAGAKPLPVDGASWQAMRLSRNRNWGHPKLIALVERFATEARKEDGWPGLLVGDISQPRGGPMLTGHASHQIGLDADIWFTPMPDHRLSRKEREKLSAISMLDSTKLAVNPKIWSPTHVKLIKRVASYPEIERVLVHPAIKKALCEGAGKDRDWLTKVRPYWGHHYHFHIRIGCPKGSSECKPQAAVPGNDGCGKELADWFALLKPKKPPPGEKKPVKKAKPKPPLVLADLPDSCKVVLDAQPEPAASSTASTDAPIVAPKPRPAVNPRKPKAAATGPAAQ